MTHAAIALQKAIYTALSEDVPLTTKLGGTFIFDDVPDGQKPPYIVFGDVTLNDWSTPGEPGTEHLFQLDIWSGKSGRAEVLEIADRVIAVLVTDDPALSGHVLVNLHHQFTECGKVPESNHFIARVSFRAVTEPTS